MSDPIHILYVDDNPLDRDLVRHALEREHGGFRLTEAATRAEFEARLAEGVYDLILTDFSILGYDGLEVLDAVRAKDPRVPVVFVTGTGSEEIAVEALKRGASDYVIKMPSHLRRLPQTIESVLERKRLRDERERAEGKLRESEEKYRGLVAEISDGIFITDDRGALTFANAALVRIHGFEHSDQLVGRNFEEFIAPPMLNEVARYFRQVVEGAQPQGAITIELVRPDGTQAVVEVKASAKQDGGKVVGTHGVVRDITAQKRAEEELRLRERRFQALIEHSADAIAINDANGKIIYLSPGSQKILGYTEEELLQLKPAEQVHPDDLERRKQAYREVLANPGKPIDVQWRRLHRDGTWRWLEGTATNLLDVSGVNGLVTNYRDITERKRAEEQHAEKQKFLEAVTEAAPDVIYLYHPRQQRHLYFNKELASLLGYSNEEIKNRGADLLLKEVHADDLPKVMKHVETLANTRSNAMYPLEYRIRGKDGHYLWFYVREQVYQRDQAQQPEILFGICQDISDRKRAEEERERLFEQVRAGREQLRALSRRLLEIQEEERRYIARELHDEVGQLLTGLKLVLAMSARLPADARGASLGEAQTLVNDLMARVRQLSLDLRPAMLDDLGLLPALLWHLERYTARTQTQVRFQHSNIEGRRFAPEIETAAYRIVQEALTNVARHAGVNEATVRLWADADTLGVQVEDQGRGFDPEAVLARGGTSGLAGMRERAVLLGGQLTVDAAPETGTRLTVELPRRAPVERREKARAV